MCENTCTLRNSTKWIVGAITILIVIQTSAGVRQTFGQFCDKYYKCDFTRWLSCKDKKCQCYNETETYFDEIEDRCVGLSGTNCSQMFFPFDEPELKVIFDRKGKTSNHWRWGNGTLRCGAHSFCAFDGKNHKCKCDEGYSDYNQDGHCLPLKKYGDECNKDAECDEHLYFKCINNTCTCDPKHHHYDPKSTDKCHVLAGEKCHVIKNRHYGTPMDDCAVDSNCVKGLCKCRRGLQIHSNNTCMQGFGKPCDERNPCGDSTLSCRSKVCQCKYLQHAIYDDISGECKSRVSGPCDMNPIPEFAIHCTANAHCVQKRHYTECQCKPDFIQTEDGLCVKKFGEKCELDSECDREAKLGCINGKCDCPDMLETYDVERGRCLGLVGSRCKIGKEDCTTNASCFKYENLQNSETGRCLCNRGFYETQDRKCAN